MILKNLWRRKTRTLLTVLGIAVGVAAVVALGAFGEGMAGGFKTVFTSASADLMVAEEDAILALMSSVDDAVGEELRGMRNVDAVCGTVVGMLTMPDIPYFFVIGEDPRGFTLAHYRVIAGEPLRTRREVMIGKLTAGNFKKTVGDRFRIGENSYTVVGIYETGAAIEDGGAVITLEDAQRSFGKPRTVNYYNVRLKDLRQIDAVRAEIETRWPDLAATRSGEQTRQTEMLDLYSSFGWFLGVFGVLVGGLGMMNTTLMSVIERTREIGVLRALGWRRRRILALILGESLALAAAGGLAGIALGWALIEAARLSPATQTILSGTLTPAMMGQAMVIALMLGTVGGMYPAWRAAQLQPIEAMRRESGVGGELGPASRLLARLTGSALRNLWRRPARTLVTTLGIGIGVGFIVALIAIVNGFTVLFTQLGGAGQIDLLAEEAGVSDASLSKIDERIADRIALRPDIRSVSKLVMGVTSAPDMLYLIVWGVDPSDEYLTHYRLREGRLIERPREVMLGRFLARSAKKNIGDKLQIGGSGYEVVGIYENGVSFEDGGSVITLRDAQERFNKTRQASFLGFRVADPARIDAVALALEAEYPEIIVSRPSNFTQRMNDMAVTYATLNALIVLTVIVGGIVMTNAMLMSVFERTQEIGVLRALGWSRGRVVRMVLVESLALSVLSALAGIALGMGLAGLFTLEPTMGAMLTPAYSAEMFGQVFLLAVALGVIGGVYPAWRAANLRPIEALRYE
ncbi:MAG: ABC transporter permease [Chloroflexi bacterium]|nr:ABC transporter permease [Chloroflexota bacterium]